MFNGLFIVSLIGTFIEAIKEACEPTIPAENWANKELIHKDIMNGVPIEQRMKNLENGKYKQVKAYPEPHRDANGKIVIENCKLYNEDLMKYGAVQTMTWVKQGKYNLDKKGLEEERKRMQAKYDYLYNL